MTGCVILFPIAVTFYITWWTWLHNFHNFYIFGWSVHVLMGGASLLSLGEWFIKRMPFVRHIYNASKQISTAISPDQNAQAFKEVAIIRHPRIGEYALDSLLQQLFFRNPLSSERELFSQFELQGNELLLK
uniref:Uncharacterized protein n=1 Tax=Ananas comosus var. bracteatus TaxID=296719 RepID=A0A6V7P9S8_ANACO|nr:unnamed protein product [Ananas comosus var. bracteatus]